MHTETTPNPQRLEFDLGLIAKAFDIEKRSECEQLTEWMSARYRLANMERILLKELFVEAKEDADYWNEEEMKIKGVGELFRIAKVQEPNRVKVFYERPLKAQIGEYYLSVVADCMVATPHAFNTPEAPYFFLQEFKKRKGEKNDPEAQMLQAMLIAREMNHDHKPIYGGFLIGSVWNFTILIENQYCVSRNFSTTDFKDLQQVIFVLKKLKELILSR